MEAIVPIMPMLQTALGRDLGSLGDQKQPSFSITISAPQKGGKLACADLCVAVVRWFPILHLCWQQLLLEDLGGAGVGFLGGLSY